MSRNAPGIGLDIGSKKIKMARISKGGKGFKLQAMGSANTPPGAVETGSIYNPEQLGEAIAALVKSMGLKGKWAVSAVSGQHVYNRNLIMPKMKLNELRDAAIFQATTFLPIPVEEAAIDIFPVRSYLDEEGEKNEIFFVAVRQQQLDNLITACKIGGLKLAAVEIEPVAINRYFWSKNDKSIRAYLNIGVYRSYMSVFKDNTISFHRYMSFGSSNFFFSQSGDSGAGNGRDEMAPVPAESSTDYLIRDMVSELQRSIEYYTMQNQGQALESIGLCGGGSRISNLGEILTSQIGIRFYLADPLEKLNVPGNLDTRSMQDLQHDFLVSLGLAARGLV